MDGELKQLLVRQTQAMEQNTQALREQNDLLMQIVAMNADLVGMVASEPDQPDGEPTHDLAGRPLT